LEPRKSPVQARLAASVDAILEATIQVLLQGRMTGVSRRILESGAPEKQFATLGRELMVMAASYLDAYAPSPSSDSRARSMA
jgi:hypothetical protein